MVAPGTRKSTGAPGAFGSWGHRCVHLVDRERRDQAIVFRRLSLKGWNYADIAAAHGELDVDLVEHLAVKGWH